MSKLRSAYLQLVNQARRLHGQTRRRKLRNGAQISVTCRNGVQMVSFSRQEKLLGETELLTFKEHCEIPEYAQRLPIEGQSKQMRDGLVWYVVSFHWWIGETEQLTTLIKMLETRRQAYGREISAHRNMGKSACAAVLEYRCDELSEIITLLYSTQMGLKQEEQEHV
jgi:hypothetical protein